MSDQNAELRKYLVKNLDSAEAHVDFDAAVKGISVDARGKRPEGMPYSPWQLLEHLRLAQRDILDFCIDPKYSAPKWPDEYWPADPEPPESDSWEKSVAGYRKDLQEFGELITNPDTDLFAKIPHGDGQTYIREALLEGDHAAYHIGELVAVRRMLGDWKKD